tara:strand:- start:2970 stop:3986 length:1017 start_codon:yes stop_codon:yes gene_type:complete
MTSTYTPLGVELMVTGENAGTWGTKTNTNLNIIEQISGGYISQAIAGSGTTAFTKTDGGTGSVVATRVIEFTGALTGSRVITFPVLTENFYLIKNTTTNAETLQLKAATGSGATVTWATDDKGWKLVYFDGVSTNTGVYDVGFGAATSPGGSTTQVQFNNSGAFGGDADLIWTAGTALTINSQKELRLADTDDSAYVGVRSHATVTGSYTLTMPAATGSADQILVTDGSGNLSFVDNSGGTAWQAVSAASTINVAAGNGYFLNTTGNAITATLPASPTLGDEISFADYAGTFDSYNLTVARNGKKIQGATADLTVSTERAAFTLVFTDDTQGWLLKNK